MRKRIVGGVLMAMAAAVAFQTPQIMKGNVEQYADVQQKKVKSAVTGNIAEQVPILLMATVDGDTIKAKVSGKMETIRYLLIDTPESKKPGMCVQPFAKEAAARNDELVRSGNLTIEMEKRDTRDAYGRLLAYVFADGKSVQGTLLREGYARVAYIYNPPYKYLSEFRADEYAAEKGRLKIWSKKNYVGRFGFNGCE